MIGRKFIVKEVTVLRNEAILKDRTIPYSMVKCLITMAVIGVEENDDNKALVYVKVFKKREWLADILNSDDLTIEILDADYKDIDSLRNLDITNTVITTTTTTTISCGDSGLCLNPDHYDAKERKIEHVATPEFDTDVINKSYVERTLRDSRNEIEESFRTIRRGTQEVRSDVRRNVEESVTRMSDKIQHLNRDVTVRIKNVVTNEMLEKSFKTTGRDMIVLALQDTQ
ncbi:hypothetical protein ALC56_03902 [Trachymyrmex septentrionalis]|uniref:Uncharacterized protein n=1 Tax=Trachymyrmex septentrionalis TaxID=34720 RepID=A0A151JYZ8_9HYME|nr:hypothetical protein ALC56_03902 [Trachymyrmex septentrionalis]